MSAPSLIERLLELAERCEQATGPHRRIDWDIFAALNPDKADVKKSHRYLYGEPYTASLDAAMTLVPEHTLWTLEPGAAWIRWLDHDHPEGVNEVQAQAATPALALTAAALRARSQGS